MTDPIDPIDPIDPTLDPVADRVRRTFATRAEDMASGDGTGSLPNLEGDRQGAPRRLRGTRRPVLVAAAVLVVAVASGGVALAVRDGDGETGRLTTAAEPPSAGEAAGPAAVTAPRDLVAALQSERNLAAATLMGIEDAVALPVPDTAQARSDTDAAVATFVAFVGDSPHGAYRSGLDGLGSLEVLRLDIDSYAGPRSLENVDTAEDVFDRYAGIIAGLLDDQQAYAVTIDDPVVRTGAVAFGRGLQLGEQTAQLVQVSMLAAVVPPSPESVADRLADLARLHAEVRQGMDTLRAETAGTPFADAADTAVGAVEAAGLLEATGSAMDGIFDVSLILDAAEALQDEGWPAFLDRVEETLAAEG